MRPERSGPAASWAPGAAGVRRLDDQVVSPARLSRGPLAPAKLPRRTAPDAHSRDNCRRIRGVPHPGPPSWAIARWIGIPFFRALRSPNGSHKWNASALPIRMQPHDSRALGGHSCLRPGGRRAKVGDFALDMRHLLQLAWTIRLDRFLPFVVEITFRAGDRLPTSKSKFRPRPTELCR